MPLPNFHEYMDDMPKKLTGVITPLLTPFDQDGRIAADLWIDHANWVLAQGAHYLSPFGTTGEALSVSLKDRKAAVEVLINSGIPPEKLMPGTGVTSLDETVELTRHAADLGCAAVMVLPSFFYTAAGDEGHFRYFSDLINSIGSSTLKICLYNIPQNSGVAVTPSLTARLNLSFPETVIAYKDSSGQWENTLEVIKAAPEVAVFPGSESFLTIGLEHGGAGCISATMNLNAGKIRQCFDRYHTPNGDSEILAILDTDIKKFRMAIQNAGLINSMKAILSERRGDTRWLNMLPPHLDADRNTGQMVLRELGPLAAHI